MQNTWKNIQKPFINEESHPSGDRGDLHEVACLDQWVRSRVGWQLIHVRYEAKQPAEAGGQPLEECYDGAYYCATCKCDACNESQDSQPDELEWPEPASPEDVLSSTP